jgi:hypothetical protein
MPASACTGKGELEMVVEPGEDVVIGEVLVPERELLPVMSNITP